MMKIGVMILSFGLFTLSCANDSPKIEWTRTYDIETSGYPRQCLMRQTSDDNFVIATLVSVPSVARPSVREQSESTVVLVKATANGDTLWTKNYSFCGNCRKETVSDFQQTADGGFIVVGTCTSPGFRPSHLLDVTWKVYPQASIERMRSKIYEKSCIVLMKIDQNGDVTWRQTYGGSYFSGDGVKQATDGGYVVAGKYGRLLLLKVDSAGQPIWSHFYYSHGSRSPFVVACPFEIAAMADSSFLVGTTIYSNSYKTSEIEAIRITANGDVRWAETYLDQSLNLPGDVSTIGHDLVSVKEGSTILCGVSFAESKKFKCFVVSIDSGGNILWEYTSPSQHYSIRTGLSLNHTLDNGCIIAGTRSDGFFFIKLDSSGQQEWYKAFRQPFRIESVHQLADGSYIACGWHHQDNRLTFIKLRVI